MTIKDKKNSSTIMTSLKSLPVAAAMVSLSFVPRPAHALISIIISGTLDLNFGQITPGAAGGTVTISPAGVRTKTGTVTLINGAGLESNGALSIAGSTGIIIDVSMTNSVFTVNDPGAGAPMNVNAFNINGGGSNLSLSLTTNPTVFPIGATLTVATGQGQGAYSGSYTVMANYQ